MPLPRVHLLTCQAREESCRQTLARFARTDWPSPPRVHLDPVAEKDAPPWGHPARHQRLTEAFAFMLRAALAEPGQDDDWLLLLEDDLEFHSQIARHVGAWEALGDKNCWLASLFNSGVREATSPTAEGRPDLEVSALASPPANAFQVAMGSFIGSQALLLRRIAAECILHTWDNVQGLSCQRLARRYGHQRPIWMHRPSLVEHMAVDSSWGARVKRAVDFDYTWGL